MNARTYNQRRPKWKIEVWRRMNPSREILVFGNTAQEAIENTYLTARDAYGIYDLQRIGIPVRA